MTKFKFEEGAVGVGSREGKEIFVIGGGIRFMRGTSPVAVRIMPEQRVSIDFAGQVYIDGERLPNVWIRGL